MKSLPTILLVFMSLVSTSIQWKLNVPRVLLPLTEEGAQYKLFSEGGCFDWKSSRPEVILPLITKKSLIISKKSYQISLCNYAFLLKVITITAIDENDSPIQGCSAAAIVAVAKASAAGKDSAGVGSTHLTSKTQAIITAEDTSSPGKTLNMSNNPMTACLRKSLLTMMSHFSSTDSWPFWSDYDVSCF